MRNQNKVQFDQGQWIVEQHCCQAANEEQMLSCVMTEGNRQWQKEYFCVIYFGDDILPQDGIFFRIILANLPMQQSLHLFEEISPSMLHLVQELERPRLRNVFTVNKADVQLTLTENFIVLSDCLNFRTPTHCAALCFAFKFQVLYTGQQEDQMGQAVGLRFEREGCQEQLAFLGSHAAVVELWAIELEKRINQRNFHKLFKAKRKIGKGAFATVYLAERLRDHRMVAVKAFSKQKQYAGDKGRDSLENEIKLMRKLSHRNIMRLEGVYQTENSIYVILEYLEGTQLNDLLKSGRRLEADQCRAILQNLLRGLSHLARCRIIHRDLKPENIMFRRDKGWDLAICDFGLATYADEEKYLFVRCGTPGFVAPEIINIRDMSTKSDPISDVFSAGVIFHHLLFGTSIFEGKKYNQILAQNRACDFNFTKDTYTKLPSATFDILTRMLEKDPAKRISADSALNHSYFTGEMEIEVDHKLVPFREVTNYSSPSHHCSSPSHYMKKELEMTPSSMHTKKEQKPYFESNRREARQFLY